MKCFSLCNLIASSEEDVAHDDGGNDTDEIGGETIASGISELFDAYGTEIDS